jgi:hypothetical protein
MMVPPRDVGLIGASNIARPRVAGAIRQSEGGPAMVLAGEAAAPAMPSQRASRSPEAAAMAGPSGAAAPGGGLGGRAAA